MGNARGQCQGNLIKIRLGTDFTLWKIAQIAKRITQHVLDGEEQSENSSGEGSNRVD